MEGSLTNCDSIFLPSSIITACVDKVGQKNGTYMCEGLCINNSVSNKKDQVFLDLLNACIFVLDNAL